MRNARIGQYDNLTKWYWYWAIFWPTQYWYWAIFIGYWVTPFRSRKTAILVLFFAVIAHFKGKCTHENRLPRDFWAFPSHCSFKQMNPSHSCLRCSEFHVGSFEVHQKRVFWGCFFTSQGAPNISRYIGPDNLASQSDIVLGRRCAHIAQ